MRMWKCNPDVIDNCLNCIYPDCIRPSTFNSNVDMEQRALKYSEKKEELLQILQEGKIRDSKEIAKKLNIYTRMVNQLKRELICEGKYNPNAEYRFHLGG